MGGVLIRDGFQEANLRIIYSLDYKQIRNEVRLGEEYYRRKRVNLKGFSPITGSSPEGGDVWKPFLVAKVPGDACGVELVGIWKVKDPTL